MEDRFDQPDAIRRLQRCINDLVSVLALPASWGGSEPSRIANTLADALLGMLQLDFVYLRLDEPSVGGPIEVIRSAPWRSPAPQLSQFCRELGHSLRDAPQNWQSVIRRSVEDEEISIVPVPLGLEGEIGVLAAGSLRTEFPEQTEKLLLSVAANQALIGLQQARLLFEQRRVTAELDARVAQRTQQLAEANDELREQIDKRKQVEKALHENERNLISIINTIPTSAWSSRPDGCCDFLNQRWLDYAGMRTEEAQGWGWTAAIHPDDVQQLVKLWYASLASGTPVDTEARMRRFDGAYRWFILRANPMRDESSAVVRWYGTNIDIEDRKRGEEALRESERRFRLIVDGIAGLVAIMSPTGEVEVVNRQVLTYFGKTVEQLKEWSTTDMVHPDDMAAVVSAWTHSVETASVYDVDHRLLRADGEYRWFHARGLPLCDVEGRILRWYVLLTDIHDRKQAEEGLTRARAELAHFSRITSLGTLTASIAHEVNQPLSGIVTNASTCLRMLDSDPPNIDGARETARRTIRDGNRASDLVTRLRALFGKKDVAAEPVDLNETAREVIALSLSELQNNQIMVQQEFAENLPAVKGDRIQLQQVILNLLRNASDAMREVDDGPRQLLIKTESDDRNNVQLSVQDTGIGFAPGVADRLFESFYTTKDYGMGIGLSVSRSIIAAHHGKIWATPNDGRGSTFAFSIPSQTHPF